MSQTGTIVPDIIQTVFDSNGNPVSGGLIYSYAAGTSTPVNTYTDATLVVANSNPVVADSAGRWTAFLTPGQSYKFIVKSAAGVTLYSQDNIQSVPTSSSNLDDTGTAGESLTAGLVVYLSDGSGSKTAGQWFTADTGNPYSSVLPPIGMTVAAISSGAQGAIRKEGQVTGIGPLVVGTDYFLSTGGALTATAPSNARLLGRADTTTSLVLGPSTPRTRFNGPLLNDFRLSLTTAVPVTTADVTGASAVTLYWTPMTGNRITLFDSGSLPGTYTSAELSIAIPATTSQLYDVYVYLSSGVPALELLAWTNDTTRATALVRTSGRYTKTGDPTRLYVGSVRTGIVSGQTEDSVAKRFLWNYYNRVPRPVRVLESTASWAYTLATIRQARATATNQVAIILGVAEVPVELTATATISNGANDTTNMSMATGIGEDSTSAFATGMTGGGGGAGLSSGTVPNNSGLSARLWKYPAVGYHFYTWLEWSQANGTTTWYGAPAGYNGPSGSANGLTGSIDG